MSREPKTRMGITRDANARQRPRPQTPVPTGADLKGNYIDELIEPDMW